MPIQVLPAVDFTGGLNLRANPFQLDYNESPDLNNVDVNPYGGIRQRGAITSWRGVPNAISNIWLSRDDLDTPTLVVAEGSGYSLLTEGASAARRVEPKDTNVVSDGTQQAVMGTCPTYDGSPLYVQRAGLYAPQVVYAFAASGAITIVLGTATGTTARDSNPGGNMPVAQLIATHGAYTFVGNLSWKAFNVHPLASRIRFSHPGSSEDWHTDDYFDVAKHDGDFVTALVSMSDRLVIFKNRSMWALFGTDIDTFQLVKIANVGCPSQQAVTVADGGLYFYSWGNGLMSYDGNIPQVVSTNLEPVVTQGLINSTYQLKISVGWINRRVWLSVPLNSATSNNTTYVYDPALRRRRGSEGAWVRYDYGVGPMLQWSAASGPIGIAAHPTRNEIVKLDQAADNDTYLVDYGTFDGVNDFMSTPDAAITTPDLTVDIKVAATDWTPSATKTLIGKWETTGNQRCWRLILNTAGTLALETSANGTTVLTNTSTVATGIADAAVKWIRVSFDGVNGGNRVCRFYLSDDGFLWTQLGGTVTTATNASLFDSTALTVVGAEGNSGATNNFAGKFYAARVFYNTDLGAFAVTSRANQSPSVLSLTSTGTTSFTDSEGSVWTISGVTLHLDTTTLASYYRTAWFDAKNPAMDKKWKRPDFSVEENLVGTLSVQVYHDFDDTTLARTLTIDTNDSTEVEMITLGQLGRSRAVQLKILSPATPERWAVFALMLRYIPRRMRG